MNAPRILSLEVEHFRSIGDRLKIDLSAPLTILLAANGTGKTSLCASGQWLLTGEALDQKTETLGNKLTRGKTKVRGEVAYHGGKLWIERGKANVRCGSAPDQLERTSTEKLLSLLFSNMAVGELAGNRMNHWLFGTRWLYANDLAILVDSDPKSVERRNDVFADLFGVRHLQDAMQRVDAYRRGTSSTFDRLKSSCDDKRKELEELNLDPSVEDGAQRAETELALAAEILGSPMPPPDQAFPARVNAVAMALKEYEAELSFRRAALAFVDANSATRDRAGASIQATAAELEKAEQDLAAKQALVPQMIAAEGQALAELDRSRLAWETVSTLAVDLEQHWQALRDRWPAFRPSDYSLRVLEQTWPMCTWEEHRLSEWRQDLERLRGRLAGYQMQAAEIASCRAKREVLVAPLGPAEFEKLEAEAKANADQVSELERELKDLSGPIERLRHEGHAALDLLAANTCPLCGKPHDDLEALRTAIRATLNEIPAPIAALQQRLDAARRHAERLAASVTDERNRRLRIAELDSTILRAEPIVVAFENEVARLGLLPGPDGWEPTFASYAQVADRSETLAPLVSSLRQGAAAIAQDSPDEPVAKLYETALHTLGRLSSEKRADVDRLGATAESAQARRKDAEHAFTTAQAVLRTLSELRAKDFELIQDFDRQWSALSTEPWHPDKLAGKKRDVAADEDRATAAARRLDIAQKVQRATLDQQRRSRLLGEIQLLERKIEFLGDRRDRTARLRDQLEEFRSNYVSRQFEALRPTVEAFFLRMHANRFLTELQMGQDGQPLRWMAAARGAEGEAIPFDTGSDFSAGQQQDLALAFFLSRACILGGTFFLDEPLAHLDDLNRVAVLDILRMIVLTQPEVGLVLTTANRPLVRHIREKFAHLRADTRYLRIIKLDGNPQTGVRELN